MVTALPAERPESAVYFYAKGPVTGSVFLRHPAFTPAKLRSLPRSDHAAQRFV